MADFGDETGESLKRVSNAFWRELFHRWLRDLEKGNYVKEQVGNETFDVKMFDDDAQRKIFEEKLREAGIKFTEKTVPAVSYSHADAKKVEAIYKQILNEIDTGTYTPAKAEQEYFKDTPASTQVKYDLAKAVEDGKLTAAELDRLGKDYSMGDVMNMLKEHPDLQSELVQTWQARADKDRNAQEGTKERVPQDLKGPATDDQLNALASKRDVLSDEEIAELDAGNMTKQRAHEIMNEHPDAFNHFKTSAEQARSDIDKSNAQPELEEESFSENALDEEAPVIEEPQTDENKPKDVSSQEEDLGDPAGEQPEKQVDAPDQGTKRELSPELEEALDKGILDERQINELNPAAQLDAQVLADLHPDVADKLRTSGIEMPEGSWKNRMDKLIGENFEKGDDITQFAMKLRDHGIGIRTAATPDPATGKPMIQYFVLGQENRSLNACNTSSKLTFEDFKDVEPPIGGDLAAEKTANAKAKADLVKATSIPGRTVAALSALDQGLPGPIPPQVK